MCACEFGGEARARASAWSQRMRGEADHAGRCPAGLTNGVPEGESETMCVSRSEESVAAEVPAPAVAPAVAGAVFVAERRALQMAEPRKPLPPITTILRGGRAEEAAMVARPSADAAAAAGEAMVLLRRARQTHGEKAGCARWKG